MSLSVYNLLLYGLTYLSVTHPAYNCQDDPGTKFVKLTGVGNCTAKYGHLWRCGSPTLDELNKCHMIER